MEKKPRKKKVYQAIDLEQFSGTKQADIAKMYEETVKDFKKGAVVKGKVLEVSNNEVLVDIGFKSEGFINSDEFKNISEVKPGDEIDVWVEEIENDDGNIVLSKEKAEQQRMWNSVLSSASEGSILEGEVKSKVKGGLIVDINGVKAFLPGSQINIAPVRNMDEYLGKTFEFKVLKINHERCNIIISRRELLQQRQHEKKKNLLSEIEVNQIRLGTVKNITDFGAFIDLGGIDGLLHITDMSWGRISHPSKILSVGDAVEVVILNIDYEKERVSLGLKQKTPNPWDKIEEKYPVGSRVHGKVVNLVPYGAFIELEEGVEGLVHVSEMSWVEHVTRASDILAIGDEVDGVVLSVNQADQRISLGIRQAMPNPWDGIQERYPIGSRITGAVRNFTAYGAFVEIEKGIDGMIHISDMSWTQTVRHPSEALKKGDMVEVIVLDIDAEKQRLSLGLKQAQEDPWVKMASHYKIGQIVEGTVAKLVPFGAFIEIEDGINGLVHISQISSEHVEKVRDVLAPDQKIKARVIQIDPIERRIGLSIKAASIPDEKFTIKEEMLTGLKPGDELVGLAGAFDEAFGTEHEVEEWRPGQSKKKPEPDQKKNDDKSNSPS